VLPFDDFDVLTFDCYGTLIDWETGLWAALQPVLTQHNIVLTMDEALTLYGALESEAERGPYRAYRLVLRMVLQSMGARLGFVPTETELQRFAASVADWPAFPDSAPALQALHKKYQLAIISNIDDDLFAMSAERLQVHFDWIITAQQAQSYKPSLHNFHLTLARIGVPPQKILHVAQSLYHDIAPAKALGLSTVWINRRHAQPGFGATPPAQAQPDLEVPDMRTLAERIGVR
jgi:2-haloacid dehalogenase